MIVIAFWWGFKKRYRDLQITICYKEKNNDLMHCDKNHSQALKNEISILLYDLSMQHFAWLSGHLNFLNLTVLYLKRDRPEEASMERSVSNTIARVILKQLEVHGVDTKKITEKCGICFYELENNGGRISEKQHYNFLIEAEKYNELLTQDMLEHCISLGTVNLSYHTYPDLFGFCLNQISAMDAINAFINYRVIIGSCDSVIMTRGEGQTRIEYINSGPEQIGNLSAIGNFMILYGLINSYIPINNIKIGFAGKKHEKKGLLNEYFESKCLFDNNINYMLINNSLLDKKIDSFNEILHSVQKTNLNSKKIELEHSTSLANLVMKLIESSINRVRSESESSIMNDVCSTLRMSRWTLNEKLKHERTTFTELLKHVRVGMACKLLVETAASIQEISELICFSSQSVFSRFFKSNLNISPLAYRNRYRC